MLQTRGSQADPRGTLICPLPQNLGVACIWALSASAPRAFRASGCVTALSWLVKYEVAGWQRAQHMALCALWTWTTTVRFPRRRHGVPTSTLRRVWQIAWFHRQLMVPRRQSRRAFQRRVSTSLPEIRLRLALAWWRPNCTWMVPASTQQQCALL